jgi:hypothetical protein
MAVSTLGVLVLSLRLRTRELAPTARQREVMRVRNFIVGA